MASAKSEFPGLFKEPDEYDRFKAQFLADPDSDSQLATVANELIESVKRAGTKQEGRIQAMAIVEALRRSVPRSDADREMIYRNPLDLRSRMENVDCEARKKVPNFDHVRYHESSERYVEEGKQWTDQANVLDMEELENAARYYLHVPSLASPTLEWLLVDQILFIEVIELARNHLGWLPAINFWSITRAGLWAITKSLFNEAVSLIVTYILATLIDPVHGIGFWTVMGAISLARWLRPSVTDIKLKDAQLFNDVAQIQGQLARTDFNARLVRERLYDLAKRGAIFSPSIYSLLDKRIQREELALLQPTT